MTPSPSTAREGRGRLCPAETRPGNSFAGFSRSHAWFWSQVQAAEPDIHLPARDLYGGRQPLPSLYGP